MPKWLIDFISQKDILESLLRIFVICAGTLGLVYVTGRLLEVCRTYRAKNVFASFCLYFISFCISVVKFPRERLVDYAWDIFIFGTLSAIPYILFAWRLFDRVDTWLDRKGLKDKKKYK